MNPTFPTRRVVVTGMGVVSANGCDLNTFWQNVRNGISGAKPITRFDTTGFASLIGVEIQNFDASALIGVKKARRYDLSTRYGVCAAMLAARDARLEISKLDADRVGVVEACSLGGIESVVNAYRDWLQKGTRKVSPFHLINSYCGAGSGEIALELGCQGHALTYSSGSASGNDVVGYALNMIQTDEADVMVAGGTEAPLLLPLWCGFSTAGLLTKRNDDPQHSMRPFDKSRDGFLLAEGAGFLVLEELSHALGRGARIYAEVAAHGRSCEAFSSVAEHPEGVGVYRAMEKALRRAQLLPAEIDYINAHGTATEANDKIETLAIKRLFGDHAKRVAVSSTKPVTGHLLAAAGAVETIICTLGLHHQEIPPTINLTEPIEGCDLDYVPHNVRPFPLRAVMNLNVGFGGKNAALILKQYPQAW